MEIPLTKGMVALIDEEDWELVSKYKWYATDRRGRDRFYARAWRKKSDGKPRTILMHTLIMQPEVGQEIDHIDRNGLNNQRANLRIASRSTNMANAGLYLTNTSGYKGVSWHKRGHKWQAKIVVNERQIYLGLFTDLEEAARAYDEAAKSYFGSFANLNFNDQASGNIAS